jgi:hypothetical protein
LFCGGEWRKVIPRNCGDIEHFRRPVSLRQSSGQRWQMPQMPCRRYLGHICRKDLSTACLQNGSRAS